MGGKPKATLTHPPSALQKRQPVPPTTQRQGRQVQQVSPGGPTWVEKGGPQKGGNLTYRKKTDKRTQPETGRTEVSTQQRQETAPPLTPAAGSHD